jgi:Na+/H+ antiporter NhaD/arsenite permease-like protein
MAALPLQPAGLMAVVIGVAAALSAVFTNDVVCLAMAPILVDACLRRGLDPVPYLLGLACASNIGSAATLIGNPQNMLIGEVLKMPFARYTAQALPSVLAGLVLLWALLAWRLPPAQAPADVAPAPDVAALVGAGLLLLSRRLHSSRVMGGVDWQLLVLFMGLFIVNHALQQTGLAAQAVRALAARGVDLGQPLPLAAATLALSNTVSNVPAVMLLLPAASAPDAGTLLALVSTLAGNLLIVGSIANIIVVDAARRRGITIDWLRHARTGVPVTVASLAVVALWYRLMR